MRNIFLIFLVTATTIVSAINPSREYKKTPNDYGLNYVEYKIKTPDLSGFQVMTSKDPGDEYLLEITDFLNANL